MPKKITKAQAILQQAQTEVTVAAQAVATAESMLGLAQAVLSARRESYASLEKLLKPVPRKPKTAKTSPSGGQKEN